MNKDERVGLVLDYIDQNEHNSLDGMAEALGLERMDLWRMLKKLEREGLLLRDPYATIDTDDYSLTEKGHAALRSGKPFGEALAELNRPAQANTYNTYFENSPVKQFGQGTGHTILQANLSRCCCKVRATGRPA